MEEYVAFYLTEFPAQQTIINNEAGMAIDNGQLIAVSHRCLQYSLAELLT